MSTYDSSRDSSFDTEDSTDYYDYYDGSSATTFDEESTVDGDAIVSDLLRKQLYETTKHTRHGQQMTAGEVAELLMKVRIEDENKNENEKPPVSDKASFSVISPPSDTKTGEIADSQAKHPQTVLKHILKENRYKRDKILFDEVPDGFFLRMTDENIEAYTKETLKAVRTKDIDKLQQYLSQGKNLQCCNKFGESIISMACREGSMDVVDFLLNEADVSIQICDDFGRTPLHNACWASEPNFDLVSVLIRKCADLCIICDKRGHTPLDYVQKGHYENWSSFLLNNKDVILPTLLGERIL